MSLLQRTAKSVVQNWFESRDLWLDLVPVPGERLKGSGTTASVLGVCLRGTDGLSLGTQRAWALAAWTQRGDALHA